jgi:MoxR-like ATPase
MQEFEVTYGGQTYPLDRPFFILATQNPIEQSGTYPLPEAQLDRFLLYIKIGYPTAAEETAILSNTTGSKKVTVNPVVNGEEIVALQQMVRQVHISDELVQWVAELIRATRPDTTSIDYVKEWVRWGAGPRAGQALILTAKARALFKGRYSVTMEDLQAMAHPVLRHRLLMNFKAEAERICSDDVASHLLQAIPRPKNALS